MPYKSSGVYNFTVIIQKPPRPGQPINQFPDALTEKVTILEHNNAQLEKHNQKIEKHNTRLEKHNQKIEKNYEKLEKKNEELQVEIKKLREQLYLALHHHYGRSSEKSDPSQLELFGEAEDSSEDSGEKPEDEIIIPEHRRRKGGRKPIDPSIPREDVLHDISPEEKSCGCGAELTRVGEDVSEEIEIIPERVTVKRHIYPRYACRCCEGSGDEDNPVFRSAKREPRLLPGSIASSSALAFILTGIIHVGCLAHVRRYFCDAVKASRKTGGARMGLNKINGIYRAYRCIRDAFEDKPKPDEQGILDELNAKVVPLLGDFESWLKDKEPNVRPSSAFGKAVSYTLGQWHKVSRFVESPYLTPDNNAAER